MIHKKSQALFKKIIKKKETIIKLLLEQKTIIKVFFFDNKVIEGCYREALVKCGKKGCHCEEKPAHTVTRLSKWGGKKLKNKIVRVGDREWVKKYSENYKKHKSVLRDYDKINNQIKEILKSIIKMKAVKYK